jgi:hypothetical protein
VGGVLGVVFAAVLVFWVFEALPFQDLPAHAGLIAMRHRFGSSPFEQRFFVSPRTSVRTRCSASSVKR